MTGEAGGNGSATVTGTSGKYATPMRTRGQWVLKWRQKPVYSGQPISTIVSCGNKGNTASVRETSQTTDTRSGLRVGNCSLSVRLFIVAATPVAAIEL